MSVTPVFPFTFSVPPLRTRAELELMMLLAAPLCAVKSRVRLLPLFTSSCLYRYSGRLA